MSQKLSLQFLKQRPLYFRVLIALFVSGIGTALTSVAVYQELTRTQAGSIGFSLAFAAGLIPGFLTSLISGRLAHRWSVGKVLILGQLAGLIALSIPLFGYHAGRIGWLFVAEATASAISGILLPLYKGLERQSFNDEAFEALASLDTFLLTTNFILGQGVGALLASHLSLAQFLWLDATTYIVALVLLFPIARHLPSLATSDEVSPSPNLAALTLKQKKALMILPWLALICAPPMILLPARAVQWGPSVEVIAAFTMAPVLLIICSRTLGQILGPLAAAHLKMARLSATRWALPLTLFIYLVFYAVAYNVQSLPLVLISVLCAHVASNVVYAVGNYQMLHAFSPTETVGASARTYRWMTAITGASGLAAGALADRFGFGPVLAFSVLSLIVGSFVLLSRNQLEAISESN